MEIINYEHLWEGLIGALLITMGILFSEKYVDIRTKNSGKKGFGWVVAGLLVFIVGWILFLITQQGYAYGLGIVVALVTIIGQIYFINVLNLDAEKRRKLLGGTLFVWIVFLGLWLGYGYQLSLDNNQDFDGHKGALVYVGIFCLMGGTIGYMLTRRCDMMMLTGGKLLGIKDKPRDIFNPFVAIVMFGWALIAVGNALGSLDINNKDE
jgi:hypothetical protein